MRRRTLLAAAAVMTGILAGVGAAPAFAGDTGLYSCGGQVGGGTLLVRDAPEGDCEYLGTAWLAASADRYYADLYWAAWPTGASNFYSTSETEVQEAVDGGYEYQGSLIRVHRSGLFGSDIPIYQSIDPRSGIYHYTIDYDVLVQGLDQGFEDLGVVGYLTRP